VHLVVAGDGPRRGAAEALASARDVAGRVHFLGRISEEEAADYYCGCDVLVFPTYQAEGFPMTVFQSLAGGLGIVTTRLRATADHLRDPDNARFVPPRDPRALAAALVRLLDDPAALGRMRRANLELARRFDRHAVAARFAALYADLLQSGAAHRTVEGDG
jgi:glycosyltransferase involved in cell wall biosynthesis